MTAGGLRWPDEPEAFPLGEPQAEVAPPPKAFVRTLLVPPGLPWEQSRTAELDARLSSPLPAGDVVYQLRRLEAWRPGAPSRYAAFYVPAREVGDRFETFAQVDGRDVRVVFESADAVRRRARMLGAVGLASAAAVFLVVILSGFAMGRRAELDAKLAATEQAAGVKLREAAARARLKAQDQALRSWRDKGRPVEELLGDLAWLSTAKVGGVSIEAVHWEGDLLAVEASAARPPLVVFGDRVLRRSAKPLRPGVYLWALERQAFRTPVAAPVAATPLPTRGKP